MSRLPTPTLTLTLFSSMLSGCFYLGPPWTIDYAEPHQRDYPIEGWPNCVPEMASELVGAPGDRLGAALGSVQFGSATSTSVPYANQLDLLAGAPGRPAALLANVKFDGEMVSTASDTLLPPPSFTGLSFAESLLGVDLVVETMSGTYEWGAGQEIIVGAPGSGTTPGKLLWYHSSIYLSGGVDPEVRDSYTWNYGGDYTHPAIVDDNDSLFGSSIVAPPTSIGSQVPWIAVAAPGNDEVYILEITSSWSSPGLPSASPFSALQVISGPPNSSFGEAMALGDFNGDGTLDIAIGAPDLAGGGRVEVYTGDTTYPSGAGPIPFTTHSEQLISLSSATADRFGAALAVGGLLGNTSGQHLAVGAPGANVGTHTGVGEVCVFEFVQAVSQVLETNVLCHASPFDQLPNQAFGTALVAGNFIPYDSFQYNDTDKAAVAELLVGAPGAPELLQTLLGYGALSSAALGAATLFRSTDVGPRMDDATSFDDDRYFVQTVGRHTNAEYGTAITVLPHRGILDYGISAPGFDPGGAADSGRVELSRAEFANGLDDSMIGAYTSTIDSGSVGWRVFRDQFLLGVPGKLNLSNENGFTVSVVDKHGDVCSSGDFDGTLDFDAQEATLPPFAFVAGEVGVTVTLKDGSDKLEFDVSHDEVAEEIEIDFDKLTHRCELEESLFTLTMIDAASCE